MVATEAYRILIIHLFTYIPPILLHILFLLVILIPNVLFWSPFLLFFSLLPLLVFSLSLSLRLSPMYIDITVTTISLFPYFFLPSS